MSTKDYDVIVVGAGVAGMTTAALLTKNFQKRVLVVEQAPFIGGRTFSGVGKGKKVVVDGLEMGPREFRKAMGFTRCLIGKCTPDLETIFEEELLDGLTIEGGAHGLFWGNKSRAGCLLDYLSKHVEMPLNKGFGFVEWQGPDQPGITHQVAKGRPYSWMSPEGYQKTMELLHDMGSLKREDLAGLMNISLQQWLDERQLHPEAYDYIKVLAASQTVQAEPSMTPAGDFLGYMAMARDIGMNLVTGSVSAANEPGPIAIPMQMDEVINEFGGEVWRNTTVQEIIIEDGTAKGIRCTRGGSDYNLSADQVICTIPTRHMFNVLDKQAFPSEWVDSLDSKYWGAGIMTGWGVFKRPIWRDVGIEPSSFVFMPGIIREGYIGAVDMVMTEITAWGEGSIRRSPLGKHDFVFSTALTDKEMRDPNKVNPVIEACESWGRATFPTWDEDMLFMMWTPAPEGYGIWRPVGEERPDIKSPWVNELYFAGDQYGKRLWGGGVDGAVLSGVMCVDSMMGSELEEQIFPAYHRGLV